MVHQDVMGFLRHRRNDLFCETHSNRHRLVANIGEKSVVPASTLAEPVPIGSECNSWNNDNVNTAWVGIIFGNSNLNAMFA